MGLAKGNLRNVSMSFVPSVCQYPKVFKFYDLGYYFKDENFEPRSNF